MAWRYAHVLLLYTNPNRHHGNRELCSFNFSCYLDETIERKAMKSSVLLHAQVLLKKAITCKHKEFKIVSGVERCQSMCYVVQGTY